MKECRELEPLLAPYADGDTAAVDRARVDAHVEACPPCREQLAAQRTVCESLRARRASLQACASEQLKARCARLAQPVPQVKTAVLPSPWVSGARRWMPLTAAATVLLAFAAVFGLGLNDKVQALAFQVSIDHAKCSRVSMGHKAADPAAAATEWRARFGWPIKVPVSASAEQLEFRGVRRCAVRDGRVAHIMYMWQGEPLSLYVLPAGVVNGPPAHTRRFGHDAVIWSEHDRTYMLISERPRDARLDKLAAYVRATAY